MLCYGFRRKCVLKKKNSNIKGFCVYTILWNNVEFKQFYWYFYVVFQFGFCQLIKDSKPRFFLYFSNMTVRDKIKSQKTKSGVLGERGKQFNNWEVKRRCSARGAWTIILILYQLSEYFRNTIIKTLTSYYNNL